jgi:hypothetical protein
VVGKAWIGGLVATIALFGAGAAALRVLAVPAQYCPPVTPASALAAAEAGATWAAAAQQPDGSYVYEYNKDGAPLPPDYNAVRHGGVTMALYMVASEDPAALATADNGLRWMRDNLHREHDWAALQDPRDGSIELGASALMLASMAQRRLATGDAEYDALMHEVARFVLAMQQPDGSFLLLWEPSRGGPNPDYRSTYATGEAFWSLTLMARIFPGEGWDAPAKRVADYISTSRDTLEHQKFPPWADQWAAYGLAEMTTYTTLDDANITYARSLAERFGLLTRVESGRRNTWLSDHIRSRESRGAGMGTWVEGLASLWRVASADPRMADMRDKIAERAACGAGMLVARQQHGSGNPLVDGAWYTNGVTRMDDQQHPMSGLLRSRQPIASMAARQ